MRSCYELVSISFLSLSAGVVAPMMRSSSPGAIPASWRASAVARVAKWFIPSSGAMTKAKELAGALRGARPLVGSVDPPFPDAGAGDDPLVVGFDHPGESGGL